jgi:hypothetical protein
MTNNEIVEEKSNRKQQKKKSKTKDKMTTRASDKVAISSTAIIFLIQSAL